MKRIFTLIAITAAVAVVMVSCSGKSGTSAEAKTVGSDDTAGLAQFQAWKMMNERADAMAYNQVKAPVQQTTRRATTTKNTGSMSSTSTNQAKVKKGWSKSAKYAVIGGVAGGVAGAVINKKNRTVGAVIGTVLGAGAGYGIGRSQDKKDGRIELNLK